MIFNFFSVRFRFGLFFLSLFTRPLFKYVKNIKIGGNPAWLDLEILPSPELLQVNRENYQFK